MGSPAEARQSPDNVQAALASLERSIECGTPNRWIEELAQTADDLEFSVPQLRSIATNLAWISRRLGQPTPTVRGYCTDPGTLGRVHLYVCGQRFRFDFNFTDLSSFLAEHGGSPYAGDALVQSFSAFAKLGARQPGAVAQLDHVLKLPDLDNRARHVCLAGIWSAHTLPEQATLLLSLADDMIGLSGADGTVFFRRAAAYRMMGRFSEALDDIDYAFSILPSGNNEVHQDYLRERQLIGLAIQMQGTAEL